MYQMFGQPKEEGHAREADWDDPRHAKKATLGSKPVTRTKQHNILGEQNPGVGLMRPDLRIKVGSSTKDVYSGSIKNDDVIIVPSMFCEVEDRNMYFKIVEEVRAGYVPRVAKAEVGAGADVKVDGEEAADSEQVSEEEEETPSVDADATVDAGEKETKPEEPTTGVTAAAVGDEMTDATPTTQDPTPVLVKPKGGKKPHTPFDGPWKTHHLNSHLKAFAPEKSETYNSVVAKVSKYFNLKEGTVKSCLNWYRDSSDYKPMHHDSMGFDDNVAATQNGDDDGHREG
jgi:hypothetical protein